MGTTNNMTLINYNDLPDEYKEKINFCPTEPFYFVLDEELGEEYGMNDQGGIKQFGHEWELIKSNMRERYQVRKLEVTVH